jgi:hypothetical protein
MCGTKAEARHCSSIYFTGVFFVKQAPKLRGLSGEKSGKKRPCEWYNEKDRSG